MTNSLEDIVKMSRLITLSFGSLLNSLHNSVSEAKENTSFVPCTRNDHASTSKMQTNQRGYMTEF